MQRIADTLSKNARVMKSRVTKYAVTGVLIAVAALVIATAISAFMLTGEVTIESFFHAQQVNKTLWVLDAMPFIFAFWGQYVSSAIAFETSAMVMDQTQDLREQATAMENQAIYEATHDPLTSLPNRILLKDRLEQALRSCVREKKKLALFILDLDHFKEINDTLGHYSGDRLLRRVALRLKGTVRESDTVARLGGDEFAVIFPSIQHTGDIQQMVRKILQTFREPFLLDGMNLDIHASIGIFMCWCWLC